jgi:FlaA1/EpsC-like NDP-sugar epimerase
MYFNVLNSRGSIIPKLKEWKGDKYYLTHENMTRFLMTQEDSVSLMTYAILKGESGDTIIPRIDAMKIKDLFEIYLEREGSKDRVESKVGGDNIKRVIEVTKMRPGEKMHESLLNVNEIRRTVERDDYYIIKPDYNLEGYKFVEGLESYDSGDALLSKDKLKVYLEEKGFL